MKPSVDRVDKIKKLLDQEESSKKPAKAVKKPEKAPSVEASKEVKKSAPANPDIRELDAAMMSAKIDTPYYDKFMAASMGAKKETPKDEKKVPVAEAPVAEESDVAPTAGVAPVKAPTRKAAEKKTEPKEKKVEKTHKKKPKSHKHHKEAPKEISE